MTDALQAKDEERKAAIRWPNNDRNEWQSLNEDLQHIFECSGGGPFEKRLRWFLSVCYESCADRFGLMTREGGQQAVARESRRQRRLQEVRAEKKRAKREWRTARPEEEEGLRTRWVQLKRRHQRLRQAEKKAEKRRKVAKERRQFVRNPFKFVKALFDTGKSGELGASKEQLEQHLQRVYSDENRGDILAELGGLQRPGEPVVPFDCGELRWSEVSEFVRRAKGASAAGQNGLTFRFFKKCPSALKELWRILRVFWRREVVPESWARAEGIYF
jgi:hypothetical protein